MKKTNEYPLEIGEIYFITSGGIGWIAKITNPERLEGYDTSVGDICTAELVQTRGYIVIHDKPVGILYYTLGEKGRRFRKATQAEIIWFHRARKDSTVALKGYFSYLEWFLKNKLWDEKRI